MLSEKSKCTVIHKGGYKMNRNPLIPFALIIVFGIGLMVAFSFIGLDNMKEMAEEKEGADKKRKTSLMQSRRIYSSKAVQAATVKTLKAEQVLH